MRTKHKAQSVTREGKMNWAVIKEMESLKQIDTGGQVLDDSNPLYPFTVVS